MKILVGSDDGTYTFTPASRQVTLKGLDTLTLEQVLIITNVATNTVIYNFADTSRGGSITNNVITLDYDTTGMNSADALQIFVDLPNSYLTLLVEAGISEIVRQLQAIRNDGGMADGVGRVRCNIETWPSTLSAVTSMTNLGGYSAALMNMAGANASAQNLRSRITVSN